MAAVLELVLQGDVSVSAVVKWLTKTQSRQLESEDDADQKLTSLTVQWKDFVPFLLNFLREQTSQVFTTGPSTPAKTPSKGLRGIGTHQSINEASTSERRTSSGVASKGSRVQLFSPTSSGSYASSRSFHSPSLSNGSSFLSESSHSFNCSDLASAVSVTSPGLSCSSAHHPADRRSSQRPSLGQFILNTSDIPQQKRGKKKHNLGSFGHRGARDLVWSRNGEDPKTENLASCTDKQSVVVPAASSPHVELNLNNLDDFPPMIANCSSSSSTTKPSRRINPTPVSSERSFSRPKICFTSTPLSKIPLSVPQTGGSPEFLGTVEDGSFAICATTSLKEEREMLKKERFKLLQQTPSATVATLDPITPTKQSYNRSISFSTDCPPTLADIDKVSCKKQLELMAQLYSACIAENLVPNIILELFFVLQLLTSRGSCTREDGERDDELEAFKDVLERKYFKTVHNCVYFAAQVLEKQFEIISLLDKGTLKLLAENERVIAFAPTLHIQLIDAHDNCDGKVSLKQPASIHTVPFQPETDNRSNFPSEKAFHIFKKERDIFYELLREWEDNHKQPGWQFERALGSRIRTMVAHLTAACDHSHFARLFQKQLIQMCRGPLNANSGADAADQDVLNMLGTDNLSRLKRLQERFTTSQSISGPCPPPMFPGCQEFFRDFIVIAGSYQLNQHLIDSLSEELLELNDTTLVGRESADGEADMDEQDQKEQFCSVLMTARLLGKFLGFIIFLPYRTVEPPTKDVQAPAIAVRNKVFPVVDVYVLLRHSISNGRTVLTVPWLVEFLSMMDHIAPYLDYYCRVLSLLVQLYRCLVFSKMSVLNKLLILALLGWLFQVPSFPEDMFFVSDSQEGLCVVELHNSCQDLDSVPLVDQQLLYMCCPYLGEFRKLMASFISGTGSKNGGFVRKITPTAADPLMPMPPVSQQKLQVELEQAFFHNQPPSLRRTVEFVAERTGSNCVKHIKATLVAELVKQGESMLEAALAENDVNIPKMLDSVYTKLCEDGRVAVLRGQEFCSSKGPEAVRVLLPEETSASVLKTSQSITVRLATVKACTWLSANITALIKKEMKAAADRIMKNHINLNTAIKGDEPVQQKRACPRECRHDAPFPSHIVSELKDFLCISLGPRSYNEKIEYAELVKLIGRIRSALICRKYMTPVTEQLLAKSTVELASVFVSGQIPLLECRLKTEITEETEQERVEKDLLNLLLPLWVENFSVPVPFDLLLSEKNIAFLMEAKSPKWDHLLCLLRHLLQHDLLEVTKIQDHLKSLKQHSWPTDCWKKFELAFEVLVSLHTSEEQKQMLDPHADLEQVE
ncbi:codanin-1 [Protopterus annectens]|uniref:codanin-1 n=1 Tax=Protopterus annectens TaxID=7888 RepID=UPI001CF9968D|nr:codanin-1 [Protopterus annectens]